jgi:phosphoribosylformylglycinamidine synthase subunit PurQ / glutaminase
MKFGVVVFPGSNCDHDCYYVMKQVFDSDVKFLWHKDNNLADVDCIILPGGFSYGDYLRTGAIARFSPIMNSVIDFANKGGLVIGICNGFQILLESGLLPGAMRINDSIQFRCQDVHLRVESTRTPFTHLIDKKSVIKIPIAHADGNYFIPDEQIKELEDNNQIVFRYCDRNGNITADSNPNGSVRNIAGICNKKQNVLGMMPHPERCSESILGNSDGRLIFQSILTKFVST